MLVCPEIPAVEGDDPDGLLLAGCGHDGLPADRAPRREPPVEIVNAVNLVRRVHREGDPVQALVADHAGEAGRVVRLACHTNVRTNIGKKIWC